MPAPVIEIESSASGGLRRARLSGDWTLTALSADYHGVVSRLTALAGSQWDLSAISRLDSAGATVLWRAWGQALPGALVASDEQLKVLERVSRAQSRGPSRPTPVSPLEWIIVIGTAALGMLRHGADIVALMGQLALDCVHLARHPRDFPTREISANLYKGGVLAMPVTALVGFLIGVVLSYLSALQLKNFGADIFIINILGLGITRELGPVLVAVLVAGRSGSAMTAQLGVMRVTEEIDALSTMGVSRTLRLVLPKVAALSVVMPLLVLWTIAMAMLGGMVSAQLQLDISYGFFLSTLPKVVPEANLWIAFVKGITFGVVVALIACHCGLRVRPNTESLSASTTASVVASITAVILVDAVFAIATRGIGVPL